MQDNQSLLCAAASHRPMGLMGLHDSHLGHGHRHVVIEDLIEEGQPAHASFLLEGVQFSVLRISLILPLGL